MDVTFRNAIFISILIHSVALYPMSVSLKRDEIKIKQPIEVDYVVIKKTEEPRPIVQVKEVKLPDKSLETPKVELKNETQVKPVINQVDEGRIKSSKDYIGYYQLIREKIRRRLKENYRDYSNEGEVYFVFTLDSAGRLIAYDIERSKSTSDQRLLDIATSSLKEAAPFPAFPKGLVSPQMSFDLTISFKKK